MTVGLRDLAGHAAVTPGATAIRFVDAAGRVTGWTWADWAARVAAAAAALRARGLEPGDRLLVVGGNRPSWPVLREAATVFGLVFVPASPRLAPPERDALIEDAAPALVLGDPALAAGRYAIEDWTPWVSLPPAAWPPPAPKPPLQLLYTSGSSGRPKGVLRSAAADAARIVQSIEAWGLRSTDRHLVVGPLYHSGPAIFWSIFRALGATQTLHARFDAGATARALAAGEADVVFMVPTMWRMVLEAAEALGLGPARLRRAFVAGSPLDPATRAALLDYVGDDALWEFYGATETGTVTMLPPDRQRSHADTVGWPAPGVEVEIRDDEDRLLPAGEGGRIWVRTPAGMVGYHGGAGRVAGRGIAAGEAITVGDRGRLRDDGSLELWGREGGMIITGGINVYPEEVEAALRGLAGVREAVVWGRPDARWGTAIVALVEPRDGAEIDAEGLREALRGVLAGYKIPREIRVGAIPRTPSRKVVRSVDVLERAGD